MDEKIEPIVQALINGDPLPIEDFEPKSRSEAYLKSALMKTKVEDLPNPASRLDVLVCALHDGVREEYDTKYDEGYSDGYDIGLEVGRDENYDKGVQDGYNSGYPLGHTEGYNSGYSTGRTEGYSEGVTAGHKTGYTEGVEAGRTAEWSDFWDAYLENGNRTNYRYAFAGIGWNNETFKPKYDLVFVNPENCFQGSLIRGDLTEILNGLGVELDTSKVGYATYFMASTRFTRVPKIDVTGFTKHGLNQFFAWSDLLETIDELVVADYVDYTTYAFASCVALKNIKITGTIGKSIYFSQSSKLDVEDVKAIITTNLKNYKGTENEGVYTFKLHDTTWTNLEASGAAPDGGTWKAYVQSLGWII